jgi:cytochrome b561
MQIHNTPEKFGIVSKTLHWLVAILIIAAWIVGDYMMGLPDANPAKFELYDLHKSVGMAVLMLVIIRLSWRLYDGVPKFLGRNRLLELTANTVHYLLYAFMFIQPLSGWAMSSAAGYNPTFFGLFTFPGLVAKNPSNVETYVFIHNTSAYILLGLFILHVTGALVHHFVFKDNTLRRMTIGTKE